MKKQQSANTLAIRRFHREYKILKSELECINVILKPYESANDNDICIISTNDYNLADRKVDCSQHGESYFVTEEDYIKYNDYIDAEN